MPKWHPITELPPNNERYLLSTKRLVFVGSCRTFNRGGKPTAADWWPEGGISTTDPLTGWARLPKAWPGLRAPKKGDT